MKFAFPVSELNGQGQTELTDPGMTLRDYFAGQALAGLIVTGADNQSVSWDDIAKISYIQADAMLKAREQS